MFTGIVETMGIVKDIRENGSNKSFILAAPIASELKTDQSVSHNGVCLTVESIQHDTYQVTAISETLLKSNIGLWNAGDRINLERCLPMNGRLDGHLVQGHVDATATLIDMKDLGGSWQLKFAFSPEFAPLLIEKGSIALNGISLTLFDVTTDSFQVAIIPYTYEHTNLKYLSAGATVNLEFDMVGKYINRFLELKNPFRS